MSFLEVKLILYGLFCFSETNPIAVSQNYILMKPCRRLHSVTQNGYVNEGLNVNFSSRPSAVTVTTELGL